MGNGGFIDSTNSDVSFAKSHSALGEISGLRKAFDPELIMNEHNMIGENNDTDIED